MSRLTEWKDGIAVLKETKLNDPCEFCYDATQKLAHYEDLEEQGRLIELPCKVGDTVWCLKEDYDYEWDAVGYKFMGICGDYIIVTSEYMGMAFKEQLEEMCEETMESENPSIYIFHKSRVFLTKEEAEAKLAELKGTEE